jgi:hypothetical protein
MKGYIQNKTSGWRHAMKRSIGPGHKIPLDDLFEQYGEKHGLEPGDQFIEWLGNVKLRDRSTWHIVREDDVDIDKDLEDKVEEKAENKGASYTSPFVKKDLEIDDVVNMTVRNARVELRKITDIRLLKRAHEQARQLAHKDTLCQYLRRRIQELELTRR